MSRENYKAWVLWCIKHRLGVLVLAFVAVWTGLAFLPVVFVAGVRAVWPDICDQWVEAWKIARGRT